MTRLGPRFAEAIAYATAVHADQPRKGTAVPYSAHLLAVASLVLEAGGDEDLAIAGLLHDAAEDHGGEERLADIEERFGDRIAQLVRDLSDSLAPEGVEKRSWQRRKREHLDRLARCADDVLLVWFADKVHNARTIATDLEVLGSVAMEKFKAPPDQVLWYYRANLELAQLRGVSPVLIVPLEVAVAAIESHLPGVQ